MKNFMMKMSLLSLVCFWSINSWSAIVNITVKANEFGDPVEGATVTIHASEGQQFTLTTDENGLAVFPRVNPGETSVDVSLGDIPFDHMDFYITRLIWDYYFEFNWSFTGEELRHGVADLILEGVPQTEEPSPSTSTPTSNPEPTPVIVGPSSGYASVCIFLNGAPVFGVAINGVLITDVNGCAGTEAPFGIHQLQFFYPGYPLVHETVNHSRDGDRFDFRY